MRPADSWIAISSVAHAGPRAREKVWQFIKDKWIVLKQRFSGQFLLPNIIDVCSYIRLLVNNYSTTQCKIYIKKYACRPVLHLS